MTALVGEENFSLLSSWNHFVTMGPNMAPKAIMSIRLPGEEL